jgi:hypothetical protein
LLGRPAPARGAPHARWTEFLHQRPEAPRLPLARAHRRARLGVGRCVEVAERNQAHRDVQIDAIEQ